MNEEAFQTFQALRECGMSYADARQEIERLARDGDDLRASAEALRVSVIPTWTEIAMLMQRRGSDGNEAIVCAAACSLRAEVDVLERRCESLEAALAILQETKD